MLKYSFFFGLFVIGLFGCKEANSQKNPNIIVVLVDDLGYNDVGFNGCDDIPTPNIDKIANKGVKFTNAYVSYAVCGPSRAGLITGRYQDRFGFSRNPLFAPNDPNMGLPKSEETLAEALKKANYKSVALGKWHLGAHKSQHPLKRGFDDFYGFLSGGHQYFPEDLTLEDEFAVTTQFGAYRTKLLKDYERVEETEYLTDALSRETINYIEKHKQNPFFIYLAYNAPHGPLQATEKYLNRFKHIENKKRRTYAAMVSAVDDGVGKILDKLKKSNLEENTMVIFLSDNGGPERKNGSDNGILRGGKSDLYEGGIRVPFAIKWPKKIPENMVYNNAIISLDIFATVIAQTTQKITTKNKIDGINLLPFLTNETKENPHEYLFWRKYDANKHATRNAKGDKIVFIKEETKLFDLKTNISEKERFLLQNEEISNELSNKYQEWESTLKNPIFLGLGEDKEYNSKHPNRYKKTN
tara:strand:+ start:102502 stop:103908 length:1407 start_codon:yes stop_codon:yes gene_type:complete